MEFPYAILLDNLERSKKEEPISQGFGGAGEPEEWLGLGINVGGFSSSGGLGWQPGGFKSGFDYGAYWSPQTYESPEVGLTIAALPHSNKAEEAHLWLAYDPVTKNGYRLVLSYTAESPFGIESFLSPWKVVGGVPEIIGSIGAINLKTQLPIVGDKFGFSMEAGMLKIWYFHGGEWSILKEGADTTYTEGFIGFGGNGAGWKLKNFEAGEETERPRTESEEKENSLPYFGLIDVLTRGAKTIEKLSKAFGGKGASGEWIKPLWYAGEGECVSANGWKCPSGVAGAEYGAYFSPRPGIYGGSCSIEAFKTPGKNVGKSSATLWVCLDPVAHSGYRIGFNYLKGAATYAAVISKFTGGVSELLGVPGEFSMVAGTQVAVTFRAGTIRAWTRGPAPSEWVQRSEAVDHAYATGYVAFSGNGSSAVFRNFVLGQELEGLPPRTQMGQTLLAAHRSVPR